MCPRCSLRIMPMTAEECFEGHARPEDSARWTAWICIQDDELVIPEDMNVHDVREANKNHTLLTQIVRGVGRAERGNFDIDPKDVMLPVVAFPTSDKPDAVAWQPRHPHGRGHPDQPPAQPGPPEQPQDTADTNDALITIAAPILAGFSLAAIVTIGTTTTVGPGAFPAMACFAGSAVLLLFSIQILAIGKLPGLRTAEWPRRMKAFLYELGLLAFLVGLGLFLWLRPWPTAAVAGVTVVGLAVICDLALVVTAWCRRDQWGLGSAAERAHDDVDLIIDVREHP